VRADDGSIRVTTSDTSQVEFRVTSEGFAALLLGGKLRVDSQQNGNEVDLSVRRGMGVTLGINTKRVTTEVRMPRNADLQLDTGNGAVEVSSVDGTISVRTGDGAIKASQLSGKIDLQTGNGAITVEALKGELTVHTGDGLIRGTTLDGKCDASSGNGAIQLAGRFDSLNIKSGDGTVVARVATGSSMSSAWSINTGDGGVEVELPKDFQANLDVSTSDGRISLGLPVTVQGAIGKTAVHGTLNGGGPALVIRTGDGSIRLNGV
jgi:DUF4097 and DUF4098 domain-containing protein YvlB